MRSVSLTVVVLLYRTHFGLWHGTKRKARFSDIPNILYVKSTLPLRFLFALPLPLRLGAPNTICIDGNNKQINRQRQRWIISVSTITVVVTQELERQQKVLTEPQPMLQHHHQVEVVWNRFHNLQAVSSQRKIFNKSVARL